MKATTFALVLVVSVLSTLCSGQRISSGQCPTFTPVAWNIGTIPAAGITWYEIYRTKAIGVPNWKCTTNIWTPIISGTSYTYTIRGFKYLTNLPVSASGKLVTTGITGTTLNASPASYITFTGNRSPFQKGARYQLLATDAQTFIALYNCKKLPIGKMENVVILSNTPTPTAAQFALMDAALAIVGFTSTELYQPFARGC